MVYLTVHLYGKSGRKGEFREYEAKALKVFRKYGGEVLAAYVPAGNPGGHEVPDEIQVLRIGSREALEQFLADPERAGMAAERDSVIRRTDVFQSAEMIEY